MRASPVCKTIQEAINGIKKHGKDVRGRIKITTRELVSLPLFDKADTGHRGGIIRVKKRKVKITQKKLSKIR